MEAAAIVRAVASFAIVVGLLVAFVWVLRRGSLGLTGGRARPMIAIETAASLGDRRSLVIVSVEGRRWLLGLAPGSVSTVAELTQAAAVPPPAAVEGSN